MASRPLHVAPPAAAEPVSVRPTYADIHLDAVAANLRRVRTTVGPRCRVLAVVKADGYGHGATKAAQTLADAGAWGLAVSLVEEGVELREAGVRAPVVVLGGVVPGSAEVIVHRQLTPVVWAVDQLAALQAAVRRTGARPLPVHLKIDTGMSRLGALPQDLPGILDVLVADGGRTLQLQGVMTHLACADDPDDDLSSRRQLTSFEDCLAALSIRGLQPSLRHACNSAAIHRFPHAHYDMVRPGIALYGAASDPAVQLPDLALAMSVHSRILAVRSMPAGARVSYGGKAQLRRASRLAVVPVGYADGYPRAMSGRAQMLVRGHRLPVVGNITMDICMLDVTDLPDVRPGEPVTLLGTQGRETIGVYELAEHAGTLSYEITCGISKRVPRRWIG